MRQAVMYLIFSKKLKPLVVLLLLALWSFFSVSVILAQKSSDTVRTKIGNPPTNPGGGTAPPAPADIRQGIINKFGITMNGFTQDHLLWSWERLHEAGDGFTRLLRGTRIEVKPKEMPYSGQVGCFDGNVSVYLDQYPNPGFFKFIILHELGHVIQACHDRAVSKQVEQQNAFYKEGGISFYARNATICFPDGSVNNLNEDYADMLAYYLDRSAGQSSAPRSCRANESNLSNPPNPYNAGGFPLHLSVAESILR